MPPQEVCDPLIDDTVKALEDNGVFLGQVYTHLGFDKTNRAGIEDAAKELLDFILDQAAETEAAEDVDVQEAAAAEDAE